MTKAKWTLGLTGSALMLLSLVLLLVGGTLYGWSGAVPSGWATAIGMPFVLSIIMFAVLAVLLVIEEALYDHA